jgi:hypothetical protein
MRVFLVSAVAFLIGTAAQAQTPFDGSLDTPAARLWLARNTSSNSSSNTSSNSSGGRSSYVHTHTWSVDSDDGRRRRSVGGTTRIERYTPGYDGRYRSRRYNRD